MATSDPTPARRTTWLATLPSQAFVLPARHGCMRPVDGGCVFDFGPPGLLAVTPTLAAHGLVSAMVLPLAAVGLASITFADWSLGMRIPLFILGLAGALAVAFLMLWPLIFAAAFRERILLTSNDLVVSRGVGPFRRQRSLGNPRALAIAVVDRPRGVGFFTEPNAIGGHHAERLGFADATTAPLKARIGTWLDFPTAGAARDALLAAIAALPPSASSPSSAVSHVPPLGWSRTTLLAAVHRWLGAIRTNPAPLVLDLAIVAGVMITPALPDTTPTAHAAYPIAAIAFLVTLALRLPHLPAGHGLDARLDRPLGTAFAIALTSLALVVGIATPSLASSWWSNDSSNPNLSLSLAIFAVIVAAFVLIGRRAFRAPTPTLPRHPLAHFAIDTVFLASLVIMTWVHEDWAWQFVADGRRGLGPMSVALLPTALALLVWPARFFYQLETPFDDGPRWRFLLLVAGFSAFALAGIG